MSFPRFKKGEPVWVVVRCATRRVPGGCVPNIHKVRGTFLSKKGFEGRFHVLIKDPPLCVAAKTVQWYVPSKDVSKLDAITRLGELA